MNQIYRYHFFAILLLLNLLPIAIIAAPVIPDAGLIMRESNKSPIVPKKSIDTQIELAPVKKPMAVSNNLHVNVNKFNFIGNNQFPTSTLRALVSNFINRELNFADLQQTTTIITDFYRNAGFLVAYSYLPEQTLENGQIEIAIVEGRLDNLHLKGEGVTFLNDTRIRKQALQNFLKTLPKDSSVTETNLNHLSLLLNQLPGINAKVLLAPGKETGSSSLGVKIKEGPLISGYASAANSGLYATGYYRFDGGVSVNDPLGIGDQLNLHAQTTETGDAVAGWADYNVALNGYGTRLGVNFAELHYSLGRTFTSLKANGIARSVGATVTQPLLLSRNSQLTGYAHYEHRWMEDNIDFFASRNDRELNVMSFSFAGNFSDMWLSKPGVTQTFINVSAGQVDFTTRQAYLFDKSSGLKTNGGYHKFNWLLNRTQNIWGPFSVYANFQGQIASNNLDTSEQITLGGPYNIRAYPVGEGSADEGWQFNFETRYQLPKLPYVLGYLELIGFIDTGFSRVNAQPLAGDTHNSRHLTGYGFGINWMEAAGFSLRTSLAWRGSSIQPSSDPSASGPMGYFQLSRQF